MKNLLTTLNSKYSHTSLAIRYLRAFVRDEKYCPDIIEYTINQHLDDIIRDLMMHDYDVISFSCYIWNIEETLKIIEDIKKIRPELIVVIGGPETSYDAELLMTNHPQVDYVIVGEGEETYKDLMMYLFENKGSLNSINGIVYRDDHIVENPRRDFIKDLDKVPFPYEDLVGLDYKKLYYESSRGCPYNCQYCLSSRTGSVRNFSLERVKKDIMFFIKRQVEQVKFVDRTFNAHPKRALEIMKFIHENDNGISNFHFEMVASLINQETIEFLSHVRTGLFQFEIGVQTTHDKTMIAIDRKINFTQLSQAVKEVSSFKNIHIHLDLIAGLPFESFDRFLDSFEEVYLLKPDQLQLGFLKLIKGSGLRDRENEYGFVYSQMPPYEIYYNNYISYREMTRLKWVEDVLERYYNSNRFINSLDMIVSLHYNRAVDFYLEFSTYWLEHKLFDQPHKPIKLYQVFYDFYQAKGFNKLLQFKSVLMHDYFSCIKKAPSTFFELNRDKAFNNHIYDYLRQHPLMDLPVREQLKSINCIEYDFDLLAYISSNYVLDNENKKIMIYNYEKNDQLMNSKYFYLEE